MTDKKSALFVQPGVQSIHDGMQETKRKKFVKKTKVKQNLDELAENIKEGSRLHLAKAITLLESAHPEDQSDAQDLLKKMLPYTGASIRIGITGVPGAGKSTFIEAFGKMLCERGHRVAVLAIDPSSTVNGGSILGDKTRMEQLSREPNAFIRPSPSAGTLGGVHKKTRETMLLCEAAGYDIVLIETMGVGQSETIVRGMVDFFLLLVLTGAGDELQGMKKGIMELADTIIVHKADGDNLRPAQRTMSEYKRIQHFLQPATPGWDTRTHLVSSLENKGLSRIQETIEEFRETCMKTGFWSSRRTKQTTEWFQAMIRDRLIDTFYANNDTKQRVSQFEKQISEGQMTVSQAVDLLFSDEKTE
ncbi:methylmalonyl Co-A mutase-associated GTPase MeaB [Rummeliibacillus stabekisii]|uniref:methylmalonyl Co-A mutase-associated GTPase MeaB n=1 Tax=Rummeliibacillus stabekisii TaxID=241244 RepID=UPI00203C9408|nr:methylmalonyl Co-A mutase-associated GTPase MeaB [Rummeliibacillus stabekisii]MCM3316275.1 methylmalonyl Co-A mutase-associated GTPase MeaB [Rummeliibacillus stabekisii]